MAHSYGSISGNWKKEEYSVDKDGYKSYTRTKHLAWTDGTGDLPASGTAIGTMRLASATKKRLDGNIGEITETYTEQGGGYVGAGVPETTWSENSSQMEVDIKLHPNYDEAWEEDKAGVDSYIVGTTTVTKSEYFTSKPSSDRSSLGTRRSPGGDYGSSANWLLIGSNRTKQGEYWVRSNTYLYSELPWDNDIY